MRIKFFHKKSKTTDPSLGSLADRQSLQYTASDTPKRKRNPWLKRFKGIAVILVILVAAFVIVQIADRCSRPSDLSKTISQWFDFDPKIDPSDIVVTAIRSSVEYANVSFYDEFVLHYVKDNGASKSDINQFFKKNLNMEMIRKDQLVLICKGTIRAGFRLDSISDKDIRICHDTISITLPPPVYLDTLLNPSDFEYFERTGIWSHQQDTQIKLKAEKHLIQDAERNKILQKAERSGRSRIKSICRQLGFAEVNVSIRKQ